MFLAPTAFRWMKPEGFPDYLPAPKAVLEHAAMKMSLKDEHPAKNLPSASFRAMEALKQAAELCAAEFLEAFQRVDGALGTEPKSEFHSIDAFVNRLDSFKLSFDSLVRKAEVKTIRQRNALLPVQKLSEELLRLIFHNILLPSAARRRRHYVRRISALRAVSSVWRELIDRTPLFWTHISSKDHPGFISDALEKSLNLPLHLKYTALSPSESESAFFDKASAHQTRWKSVAMHEPSAELLQTYFHAPNPFITALILSTDTGYGSGEAGLDKLLGGEVANLEQLRAVRWEDIVWSEAHLTQLRILEIEDYQMLGMGVMFTILAENPSLEILRLRSIQFARYTPPFPAAPQINMGHLLELELVGFEQELENGTEGPGTGGGDVAVAHILQRIRIPACHRFEIQVLFRNGSGISPEELVHLIPHPMQVVSRGRPVSHPRNAIMNAYFEEGKLQIKAFRDPRSRPSFTINLIDLPNTIARKWLTEQMGEESGQTLDLRLRFDYSEGELSLDDIASFQRWESVTCLDIIGRPRPPYGPTREFLWHLSTPFVAENGAKIMPFPRMKTLRLLDFPFKGKDLVDSITLRFHSDTPAPEELKIILGDGPGGRPESYIDSMKSIGGVKDVGFYDDIELDETYSVSSGSDWPPHEDSSDKDYVA
ncbi:hypothetical protein FS837_005540 [Tulasnella sp. UAMH 9824]|nr:hypothetical protein FS837_005540 [Tulasnella sp. UAMH 9824]